MTQVELIRGGKFRKVFYTTLNEIRKHSPCRSGWTKLLKHLGKSQADDEPLSFLTILESNGLDDTLWCLRAAPKEWEPNIRMYAVWCAKQVEHLMTDERSKNALRVTQNHALGLATDAELDAAGAAAWPAAGVLRGLLRGMLKKPCSSKCVTVQHLGRCNHD